MRFTRWLNPMLPQTLQIATMLFYINAVFSVLYGAAFTLLGFVFTAGYVIAGLGLANTSKIGYKVAVVMAALGLVPLIYVLARDGAEALDLIFLINLVFPIALFALVIHPMSRDYQRIWFD